MIDSVDFLIINSCFSEPEVKQFYMTKMLQTVESRLYHFKQRCREKERLGYQPSTTSLLRLEEKLRTGNHNYEILPSNHKDPDRKIAIVPFRNKKRRVVFHYPTGQLITIMEMP